ncbi:glyoxalase/bleomycin resistance/extradiol dioxygenase family protein [Olleya sp. UBA1516]|uniref:glyoxalase/bleomycin resistance/extradiol dioxygenase family protein n=1 Tax=Olleya sp. UBA1516 TaxID=1947013 RepID=UPI0025EED19A|nr:glyoxalase/bleomycin resistance/extradiol dioxygenase family protein [Olleya sp. UBA1516]|tara:strand:+ start:169 stop:543 length:375 start_codon:yes stop_codon:yes gene_type:complete
MTPILHQIHPILPVQNVLAALFFYTQKLGFEIAFADDSKDPKYVGIKRDHIEIHLIWKDEKEWDYTIDRPMLRIVTQHVDVLYQEYNFKNVFPKETEVIKSDWGTKEFSFYDLYNNGLTFYQNS